MERTIQELVCLSQQDRAYSEQLWERLKPLCLKWAKKFNGEQEDIEGLYQESYLVLLKALEHYDPSSEKKFESYFKMVLYRWGRNYQNKKKMQLLGKEEVEAYCETQADPTQCIETKVLKNIQYAKLHEGLKQLRKEEYELLIALYVRQEKIKAISIQYGLSYVAIESRKRRALQKLKKFFDGF